MIDPPTVADLSRNLDYDYDIACNRPGWFLQGVQICASGWPAAIRRAAAAEAEVKRLRSELVEQEQAP